MIVVDTNIICYLLLSSERSSQAEQALRKDQEWYAPLLWRSEFRSVLALYLRQKVIRFEDAIAIMQEAEALMIGKEYEISSMKVLTLIESCSCSAYDCEFAALATELGTPLLTVDRQLLNEFPDLAVSLDSFVGQ